jgi:uncharacterized membrane protein
VLVGRLLGWLLLALAVIAGGRDFWGWIDTGHYEAAPVGELWAEMGGGALPALETGFTIWYRDWLLYPLLQVPAALALAAVALLLFTVSRRRDRRRRR